MGQPVLRHRRSLLLVLLLLVISCSAASCCCFFGRFVGATPQVDEIVLTADTDGFRERMRAEGQVDEALLEALSQLAASNPHVRQSGDDEDELIVEFDLTNNSRYTITRLDVWADFYNRNGRKAADEGEDLIEPYGTRNPSRLPPGQTARVIIELDSPEDWTGGKMVLTIKQLEIEKP